jgi:hypothetical protein
MSRLAAHLEHRQIAYRLAASALVFALTLVIGYYCYRDVVFTTDENSYLFQSSTFGDLAFRRAPPPHPLDLLLSGGMNVIDPELGWFSRYPPGHALWLLPGVWIGLPRLMSALAAALSMWLLTGVARTLRAPWWAAAFFLLFSPYFLFMHGTLLTHTSSMLAVSLMLWAYLLWREERGTRHLAVAGAAWAFLYLGRPYTAALIVPAFGLDGVLIWLRRRDRKTFLALICFAGAALIGPLLALWYNYAVTGDAMQTPYLLYDPSAALGFNGPSRHTLEIGLTHLRSNLRLLDTWLWGTPWALWAFALCFLASASAPLAWLAGIAAVSVAGGYIFFYYPGFNTCGPYYYFETLPFLVLLWLLFVQSALRAPRAKWVLFGLLAVAAGSSLAFSMRQGAAFRAWTAQEAALQATIRGAPPGSVVAVMGENIARGNDLQTRLRFNPRGLDSDPLVIESLEDNDFIVADLFPDRKFFRLRNTQPPGLEPLQRPASGYVMHFRGSRMHALTGRGNGSKDENTWCRTASPEDGAGRLAFGRSCIAPPGNLKAVFDLTISNVPSDRPAVLRISAIVGGSVLATNAVFGNLGRTLVEVPFHLPAAAAVEPRVYYGGAGEVSFRSVTLMEAAETPN